jgi:hypothetical protein
MSRALEIQQQEGRTMPQETIETFSQAELNTLGYREGALEEEPETETYERSEQREAETIEEGVDEWEAEALEEEGEYVEGEWRGKLGGRNLRQRLLRSMITLTKQVVARIIHIPPLKTKLKRACQTGVPATIRLLVPVLCRSFPASFRWLGLQFGPPAVRVLYRWICRQVGLPRAAAEQLYIEALY